MKTIANNNKIIIIYFFDYLLIKLNNIFHLNIYRIHTLYNNLLLK